MFQRFATAFTLFVFFVLSVGGLLELGLRFYYGRFGSEDEQIMYLRSLDEIRRLDQKFLPMPYVNYLPSPYDPEHNRLGYRGAEVSLPKPEGVYRIAALGGSTTYSSATAAHEAYPAQLQNHLHSLGYTHVEVINAGVSGYTSWELLTNLAFRVLELEPDMILIYAGVNDLVPREHSAADCYRGENILRGLNPARGFWIERDTPLSPSVLHRVIGINLGLMANPLTLDSRFELPNAECTPDSGDLGERLANNPPVYFARNLRSLLAVAQAHDVQAVLSTWIYNADSDRPDLWRSAIAEHNAIVRALGAELDIPLYDLGANFPAQRQLWTDDAIHMTAEGAATQARLYADFLLANGLIPAP